MIINRIKSFLKPKSFIRITNVTAENNKIYYEFETSKNLDKFFTQKNMFIEYIKGNLNSNEVPESILVIPFISNLLPVVWLTDCELVVNELDKTFFESISGIKEGYSYMYKKASFKGNLNVKKLVENKYEIENKYLSLFSYGVDSLNTVIKYIGDKPMLLTLWGADVSLGRKDGWEAVENNINEFAEEHDLTNFFIKSDFRQFMDTNKLYDCYADQLENDGNWWHAVQHGIALISQATIPAYIFKVENILIASTHSYSPQEIKNKTKVIPCASSPFIDNEFKFASCGVIHDGCEFTRAEKLDNIVNYSKRNNAKFNMHVCWHSPLGVNCNICEKCARTYMYLMAIGEDPNEYGFTVNDETLKQVEEDFNKVFFEKKRVGGWSLHSNTLSFWKDNQIIFKQNEDYWKNTAMKWIFDVDFDEMIENFK